MAFLDYTGLQRFKTKLDTLLSGKLNSSLKGSANGVAELDANGKVPSSQLPSYVDDVKTYNSLSNFPATGEDGVIYIAKDTNITYRWTGSTYVAIGSNLALGETSSTAYRGDRGAAAYAAAVTNPDSVPTANSNYLVKSGGTYNAINAKYTKPASGIPASDIASGVIPTTMTGATSSAAGKAGLAPAPAKGDQTKFLRGDASWQTALTEHQSLDGCVKTTGAQSISGTKTFENTPAIRAAETPTINFGSSNENVTSLNFTIAAAGAATEDGKYGTPQLRVREFSPSSDGTSRTSYREDYFLPAVNVGRTSHAEYQIVTTKSVDLTIAGAKTFTGAMTINPSSRYKSLYFDQGDARVGVVRFDASNAASIDANTYSVFLYSPNTTGGATTTGFYEQYKITADVGLAKNESYVFYTSKNLTSMSASSGGTAVSLVTTGEKYDWNSKVSCTTANVKSALGTGSGTTKFLREDGTWQTALTTHQDISGKKNTQSAVSDPTASGTSLTFIKTITQNAQGVISPTKATVSTMGAASSSAAGSAGLVPAPAKGDQAKFLRADATWQTALTSHQDISGKKDTQNAVSDPSASGTSLTFIKTISQNTQGVISPTKATVSTMGAASSSAAGSIGLVPAPAKGDQTKFLRADATWQTALTSHQSLDSCVKITGDQSIDGTKTFTVSPRIKPESRYKDVVLYQRGGELVGRIRFDTGDATNITQNQVFVYQYSPNSTASTTTTGYYERYAFPACTAGLAENELYAIYTSKNLTSKSASSGGTGVSLVTTGEKYTWDSKVSCTTANVKSALGTGTGTTKFLREDGTWQTALTSHQSLANYVTLDGTQTITGAKTFDTNSPVFKAAPIISNSTTTPYIQFRANGLSSTNGTIYASQSASSSGVYGDIKFMFREYSPSSDHTARTSNYEDYVLPVVDTGRTSNKTYAIITEKNLPTPAAIGAMASDTVVTNVSIGANVTTNSNYPVVFATSTTDTTAAKTEALKKSGAKFYFNPSTGLLTSTKVANAIWNDYAEYRKGDTVEPGFCVTETESGVMTKSTERLMPACKLTSDTFGTSMGKTNEAQTPIAVAGRVLVYPYRDISEYHLGDALCSAPDGKVDIMTREEIKEYPERIIGTVSEIPKYEVWQAGSEDNPEYIKVNGRIWVYVR